VSAGVADADTDRRAGTAVDPPPIGPAQPPQAADNVASKTTVNAARLPSPMAAGARSELRMAERRINELGIGLLLRWRRIGRYRRRSLCD
jgi:hypothetical protein